MGDRANIVVKNHRDDPQGDPAIYLYSHWGGKEMVQILQDALVRGVSRYGHTSYLTRIIFDEMTKGFRGETGFGISTRLQDNGRPILVVTDACATGLRHGTVEMFEEDRGAEEGYSGSPLGSWSFEQFCNLPLSSLPADDDGYPQCRYEFLKQQGAAPRRMRNQSEVGLLPPSRSPGVMSVGRMMRTYPKSNMAEALRVYYRSIDPSRSTRQSDLMKIPKREMAQRLWAHITSRREPDIMALMNGSNS